MGVFIAGKVQGYSLRLPKEYPQNKLSDIQENSSKLCGTVDVWITVSCPTFFLKLQTVKNLEKEQKKHQSRQFYG